MDREIEGILEDLDHVYSNYCGKTRSVSSSFKIGEEEVEDFKGLVPESALGKMVVFTEVRFERRSSHKTISYQIDGRKYSVHATDS